MENTVENKRPPVMLYTEQTPNPETLKFVTNQMLYPKRTADFKDEDRELAEEWSPLAAALFAQTGVNGVYICNNFVTITKGHNFEWADIMLELKSFIKNYLQEGKAVVKDGFDEVQAAQKAEEEEHYEGEEAEIVVKIKNILETYVRPAVEMDGGNIEFKAYKDGIVSVVMQGACSGCPSSSVTLKTGIEGMLKRMIPQVKEVNAIMG
ncbi:NifU family protein [Saprospira grandis]|uniref:Nitrogen-fixing NifU domain protein n=1 Tax=Saprospira grandis (strain Lewin) TaxID=984262 RepID=H6L3A0_SAPGL|nr:NifU family protein [Saprospira grandis]AFC24927.1 nitrogen-fixing NifU domain protein [Saprospira grandis str. Lewin]